jgi:hypothetical protein
MRAVRILAAALSLGLLSSSAWAQFAQPPVSSYTVNFVIETSKGYVLNKGAVKCQTLKRCDGPSTKITVGGTPRVFSVTFRWDGAQLDHEVNFLHASIIEKRQTHLYLNRPGGKVFLKDKETGEELLYDTPNGVADRVQYEKGPVAKVRVEVRT